MPEKTSSLTVPIRATKAYKAALKAYASDQGKDMADIVREAVDYRLSKKLKRYVSFFEKSGQLNGQSGNEKTTS